MRLKRRLAHRRWLPAFRRRGATDRLNASEGYRLWASSYSDETAISFLEDALAQVMLAGLPQRRLLDAGCGIGRRIAHIPSAVGMDASAEMLAAGACHNAIRGDVRAMPFAQNSFDMVWCRLVLGHLSDVRLAYSELARVCAPGGHVFVSDFHADAIAAGHQRTFSDGAGVVHEIEHYVHSNHAALAGEAGLALLARQDAVVGPAIRHFYERGIGIRAYRRDAGLKLVAAYLFRKPAH